MSLYNKTIKACFVGYIVQAIINNFVPLLFITFQTQYDITLAQITLLVTFNFGIQLMIDVMAIFLVDLIGYRISMLIAHFFSALGLILITILPEILPSAFLGLLFSVMIYAIGGGLLEVLISPIVEACPSDNKEKTMSILHSFYCLGHAGVVLISTVFFSLFSIENWKYLSLFWALVPLINLFVFTKVRLNGLKDKIEGLSLQQLFKTKVFWIFLIMMLCAGASEQAINQWVSSFMEEGLSLTKTIGDLLGPLTFAILMGISRAFFGKYGERVNLERYMFLSAILCVCSYLTISLINIKILNLLACALCGLAVGIMWPGTFSESCKLIPKGGTAMFAFFALGGDLGCAIGPTVVGLFSSLLNDELKMGIFVASIFPLLFLICLIFLNSKRYIDIIK